MHRLATALFAAALALGAPAVANAAQIKPTPVSSDAPRAPRTGNMAVTVPLIGELDAPTSATLSWGSYTTTIRVRVNAPFYVRARVVGVKGALNFTARDLRVSLAKIMGRGTAIGASASHNHRTEREGDLYELRIVAPHIFGNPTVTITWDFFAYLP